MAVLRGLGKVTKGRDRTLFVVGLHCWCVPPVRGEPEMALTQGRSLTVTGYISAYQFILLKRGIFGAALEYWAKAFFCCTLATNVLVTGLIAGRIWAHGKKLDKSVGSLPSMGPRYWGILAIIIESGALYSSALIIEIVLYASKTNAIYVLFDGMAQVIVSAHASAFMATTSDACVHRESYQR